jgi:uncharacterized delta-60 repeat protein
MMACLTLVLTALSAGAAPGDFDSGFAGGGRTRIGFNTDSDEGNAVAVQLDQKLIVAGTSYQGDHYAFSIFRYNTDGSRDRTFNFTGNTVVFFGVMDANATAVAIQGDGKIVVAGLVGAAYRDFGLVRLNSDGTLDQTFGTSGKVLTDIGSSSDDRVYGLTIQGDGRIVAVGYSNGSTVAVRYHSDGSLDGSFGSGGKALVSMSPGFNWANAALIQSDGKILLAGVAYVSGVGNEFGLFRLQTNGVPDASFGVGGAVTTPIGTGGDSTATSIAIQFGTEAVNNPDRIVVAGYSRTGTLPNSQQVALARYNMNNGSLDTTFNGTGKLTQAIGAGDAQAFGVRVTGLGIQPRKIIVAGSSFDGVSGNFTLARFTSAGALDSTFAGTGIARTPLGAANALALENGLYVAVGRSVSNSSSRVAMVRYKTDGTLDSAFDGDGILTDGVSAYGVATVDGLAVQPDGGIIAAGTLITTIGLNTTINDFALTRLKADGSLDSSFGTGGKVWVQSSSYPGTGGARALGFQPDGKIVIVGGAFGYLVFETNGAYLTGYGAFMSSQTAAALSLAIQPDGKIILVGRVVVNNGDSDFALARFNANGSPDLDFDGDGMLTTSMGTTSDGAYAVALQADSKIIAGGAAGNALAMARYFPDGSLDPSFNFDGKVTTGFPGGPATIRKIALTSDKILTVAFGGGDSFILACYTTNGFLDTTFGHNGFATNSVRSYSTDLAVQPNGKILVGGYTSDYLNETFLVTRFTADGALDTTFGTGGTVIPDMSNGRDLLSAMTLDQQGKLIVAGQAGSLFGIGRLLGDVLPRLNIARSGNNVELSWGTDALGFLLQSKTNLLPTVIWDDVANSRSTNRVVVPPSGKATYYRLKL